ncbi:MAG: AAA family ATPase [Pseudomonadota bacterium]
MHVLITGAAGSGSSTLGRALATELNAAFIEADDIYWLQTSPPFKEKRTVEERRGLMLSSLHSHSSAVVAGSVMEWGSQIEDAFDLVVFLYVEADTRIKRLRER